MFIILMVAAETRQRLVQAIIAGAWFMHGLDTNIVATSLPQIANSFDTSPVRLSIAITAYMVSIAVFIPISGWLADRFGSKRIFGSAIALFTLSSVLCGISTNLITLAVARALQGMGGAMMMPIGRLVVLRSVPKVKFVKTMALISMAAQIGPLLGPPIGGFITTYLSWRWNFLINVPIGGFGFIGAMLFIDNERSTERRPLDWKGFMLTSLSLFCLIWGVEALGHGSSGPANALIFLGTGFVLGTFAIIHAKREPNSLINLSLLRIGTFRANATGGVLSRMGNSAITFLLPLLFQSVFGMTALASGLLTFVNAAGAFGSRAMVPRILRRFGFRSVVIGNAAIGALAVLLCTQFSVSTPVPLILAVIFIGGMSRALQFTSLSTLAYADIEAADMSSATSFAQLMQQLGQLSGVAVSAAIVQMAMTWRGDLQLTRIDIQIALVAIATLVLSSVYFFIALPENAGGELSGHDPKSTVAS